VYAQHLPVFGVVERGRIRAAANTQDATAVQLILPRHQLLVDFAFHGFEFVCNRNSELHFGLLGKNRSRLVVEGDLIECLLHLAKVEVFADFLEFEQSADGVDGAATEVADVELRNGVVVVLQQTQTRDKRQLLIVVLPLDFEGLPQQLEGVFIVFVPVHEFDASQEVSFVAGLEVIAEVAFVVVGLVGFDVVEHLAVNDVEQAEVACVPEETDCHFVEGLGQFSLLAPVVRVEFDPVLQPVHTVAQLDHEQVECVHAEGAHRIQFARLVQEGRKLDLRKALHVVHLVQSHHQVVYCFPGRHQVLLHQRNVRDHLFEHFLKWFLHSIVFLIQ